MHYKYCYRCGEKINADIKGNYCEKCKSEIRKDKKKYSISDETQKVYNSTWDKVRKEALKRANYRCEICEVKGVTPIVEAEEVHHIIKVRDGNNSTHYDLDNLVCVCKKCHKKIEGKNKLELIEYLKILDKANKCNARLVIVYGPPCSGKTTYVKEHMDDGDIVIDMDYIKSSILFKNIHDEIDKNNIKYLFKIREFILKNPKKDSKIWLITTKKEHGLEDYYKEIEVINTLKSKDEIYKMVENDKSRKDKEKWRNIVDNWFLDKN